jgi:hypothetical protein
MGAGSQLRSFSDVARFLPRNRRGKKVHVSTLHRWRASGYDGVRLRCVKTPGGWRTSLEAVEEFFRLLTERKEQCRQQTSGQGPQADRHRRSVEQQLDTLGI